MPATLEEPRKLTIEEEVAEIKRAEIAAFEMPKPCLGQCVAWFPDANKSVAGEIAFVLRVSKRNIEIRRSSGTCETAVRHIDDPKLQLSVDQRASGGWDFTEHDKKQAADTALLADLAARVTVLEQFLNEPAKPKKDKKADE